MKEKNKYQRTINKKNEEHRNLIEEVSWQWNLTAVAMDTTNSFHLWSPQLKGSLTNSLNWTSMAKFQSLAYQIDSGFCLGLSVTAHVRLLLDLKKAVQVLGDLETCHLEAILPQFSLFM